MIVRIPYHPSEPQKLFHESTADECFYGGQAGGGKSAALVSDALVESLKHPKLVSWFFRATYQQGKDTLLEELRRRYPPDGVIGRWESGDTTYGFHNGAKIRFRQVRTLEEAKKYDGTEFNRLYIDEAQNMPYQVYDYLCTRVRANKELHVDAQVKLTGMPGGIGNAWLKRMFISLDANELVTMRVWSDYDECYKTITRQFIPATIRDNKHIDSGYTLRLEQRGENIKRALLYGDWNVLDGQAFPEWRDEEDNYDTGLWTHVIAPFDIPAHWRVYRSYDYGSAAPYSVLWFAKGDETVNNRLFMIHELYGGKDNNEGLRETVSQQAEKIAAIEAPLAKKHGFIDGVADPSIFSKSPYGDESIASVMQAHGVEFRDPRYDKDVGQNIINNRLQGKQLIHEALLFDTSGRPGVQVFSTCKQFRKHFPELMSDKDNPEDVESKNTEDHDYDAFRYLITLTQPRIKKPTPIYSRRRLDPLDMGTRIDDGTTGRLLELPDIIG